MTSNHRDDDSLPSFWARPYLDAHPTLFRSSVDEALTEAQVTRSDLRRWKKCGWISYDIDSVGELDWREQDEIRFIRHLVMSGIGETLIDKLLAELPSPYRYEPNSLAYHFEFGWVKAIQPDAVDVIEAHLDGWLGELSRARLHELADKIAEHLEGFEDQSDGD